MNKCDARKQALDLRKQLDNKYASEAALEAILKSNILDKYNHIGLYYPIGKEINLLKLVELFPNKRFYLPVTKEDIYFAPYSLNDELLAGPFKTYEPATKEAKREEIELFIIPCVAITKDYKRIGYGKGYYDRYLKGYTGIKVGVCYKESTLVDATGDDFDVKLDYIF